MSSPPNVPKATPPPEPLKDPQARIKNAQADALRRAAATGNMSGTLLTGGMGLTTPAMTQQKSLLGQ